jgi:hypothetical protein
LSSELVTDGAAASPSETQIVAGLERELADDDRDAAWAREIESQAADALASYEGQRVLTIECRSRLCRMEIASDDLARQDELLADLALTPPFNTEGFVHVLDEPEVEPRFVAYFAREGQSLPSSLDAS